MATLPTAAFWIRTDGSDANGGGYDSGIGGAATNYCDQASPQATFTLLTLLSGTLTDTGSLGLFTAAMIGNAVNVPGQGYYWITARANGNVVTVTPGTNAATSFTTQPGKVGGALRNFSSLSTGANGAISPSTATPVVPGNTINIRSGGGSVVSPDYTQTGYVSLPAGDATNGKVHILGYNGTPIVSANGLLLYGAAGQRLENVYWLMTGTSNAKVGVLNLASENSIVNCTVDVNNQAAGNGIVLGSNSYGAGLSFGNHLQNLTIKGGGTSSASGISVGGTESPGLVGFDSVAMNCSISGFGSWGVTGVASQGSGLTFNACAIYGNAGGGVLNNNSGGGSTSWAIIGCTIDDNGGDGIQLANILAAVLCPITNTNITNNSGYGINVATGTATANTAAISFADYNNIYNNTSGPYHNLNAGAHDVNLNPGYTAGGGAYTPTANVAALIAATAPIGFA